VKRPSAALMLTALLATVANAQVSPADPPPGAAPQTPSPAAPPSHPSTGTDSEGSKTDRQAQLMKHCMIQVQGAQPDMAEKDAKEFCDKQVNRKSSPQS
jgi:hypothetical protein